ncbi:allophanate hydrolase subunit 1 [Streptomyces sp. NPDC046977]|uniref:5-oxoprolinase subunit B family protein n=1 Tax=Streptomyces sp. NPDC046977 TaxID=3154703 RepID=UPI0033DBC024
MRLLPVGDDALLLDLDSSEQAQAWHTELLRRRDQGALPPVREIVPGDRTVLLDGVPDLPAVRAALRDCPVPSLPPGSGPLVDIPVRYDGADLGVVAETWGVSREEVVRLHSGTEHRVAFCGFAPGFAYMTGMDERYAVPRRAEPRTSVPAGSVALAGHYTGIYPRASPGGWQVIGTTDARLWDLGREPAALLVPGTRVRFAPVGDAQGETDA